MNTMMTNPFVAHPISLAEATHGSTTVDATGAASMMWLVVALPLLSAIVLLLAGRRTDRWGHLVATAVSWVGFIVGAATLLQMASSPSTERIMHLHLFDWIQAGSFSAPVGFRVDQLSMTFVMLVTFVGSLIHVYSIAYMEHDKDRRRFFAYLNLFIAAMLLLVLADNYLLLYVGWEGVGLASYLLIGFWNHHKPYATAAKKAFVMNRVGDIGMALAIMTVFFVFGSVTFDSVLPAVASHGGDHKGWMTFAGLMLLLAACGKSAQFPLQAWLGDAMAGPTPVSALIHAATMVTAGVYLIVRSGPIFEISPTAQLTVVIVGAITLTFGAIIGCAKDDIKKALAASTMSQIGYMMLAAGLGPIGYAFAIFHLVTHGFFKAGMFLGAGSVMHGMNDQVDMRQFGNLSKYMKITWLTFGAGWLAIIGIPGLSGWWSKDKIIEAAFMPSGAGDEWRAWLFGTITLLVAGLTAFYMSRLFFMTFHGTARWSDDEVHPHESPILMTAPMMILSVGSLLLGGILAALKFPQWLEPVVGHGEHHEPVLPVAAIQILAFVLVVIGVFVAYRMYATGRVPQEAPTSNALTRAARRDLYQDRLNESVFAEPGQVTVKALTLIDKSVVNGLGVGGLIGSVRGVGSIFSRLQSGFVRSYAAFMVIGLIALGTFLVVR